jgi:hypothetical protein
MPGVSAFRVLLAGTAKPADSASRLVAVVVAFFLQLGEVLADRERPPRRSLDPNGSTAP